MHNSSLFSERCKMRGAATSIALERNFAEHYHYQVCIFKARASGLHLERHKTWPGKALAFWDALAIKNNNHNKNEKQAQE